MSLTFLLSGKFCRAIDKSKHTEEGGAERLWIERGTVLTMNVALGRGANAPVSVCKFRVMGVYDKFYNKWFLTEKRHRWAKTMDEKEKRKYRFVARMLKRDNVLDDCADVELGGLSHYKDTDILRLEDGSAILDVTGKLAVT